MKMLKALFWLIILLSPLAIQANSAQPGFWNAGGTGTFSLLFPEDSVAYKKVQMVRELVAIQLYPGYAVVKGSYWMHNTTGDSLSLKAGYPLYGSYEPKGQYSERLEISFDSLSAMRVRLEGIPIKEYKTELLPNTQPWQGQWYIFQTHFGPLDTVLIEVYFILNTNNTSIRQGYGSDESNGFIYLLETGATWKQPILQGEVRLQMMGVLDIDDIHGAAPDSVFKIEEGTNTLVYSFSNLAPDNESNIVVAYSDQVEDFDFGKVIANQDALYKAIETFAAQPPSTNLIMAQFGDPYELHGIRWNGILFLSVLVVCFIVVPVVCIVLASKFSGAAFRAYKKATKP
ncbi:hypothetical protein BH09BAC1_BH09BAC1_19910 [soil metagenome]